MKREILFLLLILISFYTKAAELHSVKMDSTTLYYYFSESSVKEKKGLMVFMHGGVSQFMKQKESKIVPIETLLENNIEFLTTLNKDGYDVVLPVAFNEFNWLEMKGKNFIDTLIRIYKENNQATILAGFSDGGTGAYKYFYTSPESYNGVVIFNGYPQHQNFYKTVDYLKVTDKKVLFIAQYNDNRIPYEFLLREYRRQKMVNISTYFLLKNGRHRFNEYVKADFEECLSLLDTPVASLQIGRDELLIFPPIDGLVTGVEGDKVIALYAFRKKAVKKYGMSVAEYQRTDYDYNTFNKMLLEAPLYFFPTVIRKEDLMKKDTIEFTYEYKGKSYKIMLNNFLKTKTF